MAGLSRFLALLTLVTGLAPAVAHGQGKPEELLLYQGPDRQQRLIERAKREGTLSFYTSLAPTESQPLSDLLRKEGCKVVVCEKASEGMGASLACAVRAVQDAEGFLVALADMPFIRSSTIAAVRDALAAGAPLVAPYFRARRGHPVGFAKSGGARALEGDEARAISFREEKSAEIAFGDPAAAGHRLPAASRRRRSSSAILRSCPVTDTQMSSTDLRANIFFVDLRTRATDGLGDSKRGVVVSLSPQGAALREHVRPIRPR